MNTQNNELSQNEPISSNSEIVIALAEALNNHDLDAARALLSEDLKFEGVFGGSMGAEAYLKSLSSIKANQDILKVFADGDDVSVFYYLTVAALPDKQIFGSGWFKLKDKKIVSIRVVFDPSPLKG